MEKFEFTKKDTAIVKGISIVFMFMHHLFAFPDRINVGSSYISLFSMLGTNVELLLGQFGKICVAIFLFLSGFGIYKKIVDNRENTISILFKKLKALYINYWIIFLIFIPISFFIGSRVFNFDELFDNLIGYKSTYNGEWWFFQLYILTIITFPITIKVVRNSSIISIVNIILISVATRTILPVLINNGIFTEFSQSFFYNEISFLLGWLPCFLMGCTFAKFDLFPKIKKIFRDNRLDNIIVYALIYIGIMYIRHRTNDSIDFDYLFAPIFIIASDYVVRFLRLDKLFAFLGKHSTNMWLIHSFFCYQYFQTLVYYPKISIIVVIWLTILCVISSWIIMYITKEYNNLYKKVMNKLSNTVELDI